MGIEARPVFSSMEAARYNLAVWRKPGEADSLSLVGREVAAPGQPGEPDIGTLKLFEINGGTVVNERVIWKPVFEGISLEDPRALELPNKNIIIIGLTAVLRDRKGHPIPFPAIVKIDSISSWRQELPPFLVIETFGPGKNITPVDESTYIFRPDSKDYSHKLLVFSLHSQIPEKMDEIVFPTDLPWADWKIGTTMPPIWITPDQALFIIHGISRKKIDGKKKYVYSIGRAKLTRNGDKFEVTVAPEPIITPDDFLDSEGKPLVEELHPELRRVIYSCGGVIKNNAHDTLSLFVNVGDRTTFEVELPMEELKKDLF